MAAGQPAFRYGLRSELLHYRIQEELGAGGMGVVYRALDTKLNRQVALKFLPPHLAANGDLRRRFEAEARMASALDHVNVGTIYGVEETAEGQPFIVMAFYAGETLTDKIGRGPLPLSKAVGYAAQIARGLAAAHDKKILHRDIKPSNIIVTSDEVVKIVDFGIAIFDSDARLTRAGEGVGTPHYMSPEQASGKDADYRSDVWSIGVVLFEMVSGKQPFCGDSVPAIAYQIVHEPVPELARNVPVKLSRAITTALAKDPAARYQSAREMEAALADLAGDLSDVAASPTQVIPLPAVKRAQIRRIVLLVLSVLVIGTGLLIVAKVHRPVSNKIPVATNFVSPRDKYLQAVELVEQRGIAGNLDKAIALFQECIGADPGFALAHAKLGEAYWLKYRMESNPALLSAARTSANRALTLDHEIPTAYVTLGNIDEGAGQHEMALSEFERALKLDARNLSAFQGLAKTYDSLGRPKDAEAMLLKTVELSPDSWQVYSKLGKFYADHNRLAEAVAQYREVVKLAPTNPIGYSNLGAVLLESGRTREASEMFRRSVDLSPTYFAYSNLGTIAFRAGEYSDAARYFEKAAKLNDTDYELLTNLAVCYRMIHGFDDKSRSAYERADKATDAYLKVNSKDAQALAILANLEAWLGRMDNAKRLTRQSLTLAPGNADIEVSAASVFELMGDRAQALVLIKQGISHGARRESIIREPDFARLVRDPGFR